MNIFPRNQQEARAATIDMTLAGLFAQAEQLGRVSVEMGIFSEQYEAEITFKNRNGSSIKARAKRVHIYDAMMAVIQEALALGAIASMNTR